MRKKSNKKDRKRKLQERQTAVEMMFRDVFPDVKFVVVENEPVLPLRK